MVVVVIVIVVVVLIFRTRGTSASDVTGVCLSQAETHGGSDMP